jgi:hypothetical protein
LHRLLIGRMLQTGSPILPNRPAKQPLSQALVIRLLGSVGDHLSSLGSDSKSGASILGGQPSSMTASLSGLEIQPKLTSLPLRDIGKSPASRLSGTWGHRACGSWSWESHRGLPFPPEGGAPTRSASNTRPLIRGEMNSAQQSTSKLPAKCVAEQYRAVSPVFQNTGAVRQCLFKSKASLEQ